jgi:uncharacterized protein YbaP (TraB family)
MKIIIASLLALICSSFCFSRELNDTPGTLLWAIVTPKGDTSYLFGTFHEFGISYLQEHPRVMKQMEAADIVYLEEVPDKRQKVKHVKWTRYLSAEERTMVNSYLKRKGLDGLKRYKKLEAPDFKYYLLSEVYAKVCHTRDTAIQFRMEEYMYADRRYILKKQIAGLEQRKDVGGTVQWAAGETERNDSVVVRHIVDIVMHENKYADSIRSLKQCEEADRYRNATVNYHFTENSTDEDSDLAYALDERNLRWLPEIERAVGSRSIFVAVGMKHLWYKKGLINLLKKDGYKVVPVAMK